ncbi:hypothetical protein ACJX0J_033002, partial [Zea mays]
HIIYNGLIILQYKSEIALIFMPKEEDFLARSFKHKPSFLWQQTGLYFILVKDARIKNWQLFDGYHFAIDKITHVVIWKARNK